MATCDECLHFTVCEALEQGNGIKKVYPIQCGCFKDKANFVEVVRCKDCEFVKPTKIKINGKDLRNCDLYKRPCYDDDFCGRGELKECEGK